MKSALLILFFGAELVYPQICTSAGACNGVVPASAQEMNQILWIDDRDSTVRLVDMIDPLSDVCELPEYPANGGHGITLAFSDQTGNVVVCGEHDSALYNECFTFDGISWEPLPPLQEKHSPHPYDTNSFFMEGLGLWVGGGGDASGVYSMVNELLNSEGQWITLPVDSPYAYYPAPCAVPLNSTHIFLSGGYKSEQTWILDLENLLWTSTTAMLSPRRDHGCVLTAGGEVLIAGGYEVSSVHIFNPVSLEWRESGYLSSDIEKYQPHLMLWVDKIILVEHGTDFIWERENEGWRLTNFSMGSTFQGDWDNAVMVPDSWRKEC